MKKKIWWIAGAVGVVLLFVGAFFLYDSLREDYAPGGLASREESENPEPEQPVAAPDLPQWTARATKSRYPITSASRSF